MLFEEATFEVAGRAKNFSTAYSTTGCPSNMPTARSSSTTSTTRSFFAGVGAESAFAQFTCQPSPKVIKSHMLVTQFVARKLQEGNCACRTKRYADHAGLFIGIDRKTLGVWAADAAAVESSNFVHVVRVVQARFVFEEMNDQADTAVRH